MFQLSGLGANQHTQLLLSVLCDSPQSDDVMPAACAVSQLVSGLLTARIDLHVIVYLLVSILFFRLTFAHSCFYNQACSGQSDTPLIYNRVCPCDLLVNHSLYIKPLSEMKDAQKLGHKSPCHEREREDTELKSVLFVEFKSKRDVLCCVTRVIRSSHEL